MSARLALPRARALLASVLLAVASLALGAPAQAIAHELAMTTARVSLRDEHLDVHLELDAAALLAQTADLDARALASASDAEIAALSARAQESLLRGTELDADGARVPLTVRSFPAATLLRSAIARRAASSDGHGEMVSIDLEAARTVPSAKQVTLRLPPSLGESIVTFVQPATRWIQPATPASFPVLAPPNEPVPPAPSRQPWLAGAALVLALAAALANLSLRRKKTGLLTRASPLFPMALLLAALPLTACGSSPATGTSSGEDAGSHTGGHDAGIPDATSDGSGGSGGSGGAGGGAMSDDAGLLTLTSSEFQNQGTLPIDYTCDGAGLSPPLAWTGIPQATVELALLMTTVAKDGLKWNWVLYHIPPSASGLLEGDTSIGKAGLTSDGPKLAYSPPCSQGPGAKTYTFTLHALSAKPSLALPDNQVTGKVITDAISGITLASSSLSVSYTRP